jgi:O-antigen/teichoic acid export membrane protein
MNTDTSNLSVRAASATQWRFAGSAVSALSQLGIGVLLAHLLTPADFGLSALAYVVLGLARPLCDLGVGSAVIQRTELTDRHVRVAFTLSVLFGIAIASTIALTAPLAARVMRDPEVAGVMRTLAIGFAIGGTAVVAGALQKRNLDFEQQFAIDVSSYIVGYGGVTVVLALTGHGVWSLVWGGLAQTLLASCAQLAVVRHSVLPLLARREMRDLMKFGFGSAMNACVNYVALNADNFIVGRSIGVAGLGLYSRAYNLMNLPAAYGANIMSSVMFPALAQVQQDAGRVRRAFLLLTRLTAMIAAPAMCVLALVAPYLVRTVYGPKWGGVVLPLRILCAAGYFRALYHLGGVVAQSVGRVYAELQNQIVYAVLVIAGAVVGSRYGLSGVAVGVSVAILYMFIATGRLALNVTGATLQQYVGVQVGALATAGVACCVALATRFMLERSRASGGLITLAILGTAAVPWAVGLMWTLGAPGCEALIARLPWPCARLILMLRGITSPLEIAWSGGWLH